MTLAVVYSRANSGISAPLVTVEVHISRGMPRLNMVGLPETAVQESKDRVRSALLNTAFEFPARRITINLAPADLPKEGGRFDLPIALGILAASGQIPKHQLTEYEFAGELALSGELRPVRGTLPMAMGAMQAARKLIVPHANGNEAALVNLAEVYSAKHLLEVCAHLKNEESLLRCEPLTDIEPTLTLLDLADVRGQPHAKRALEIAAAGKHSLLFIGPPGTGKTMLASRLVGILPPLTDEQALEAAAIASISSNGFDYRKWRELPYRAPHHSSSSAALVGGGRPPRPGEISLAHHGLLFLDELPEFNRRVLESLREPLESGHVTISRAAFQAIYPAKFQLIAAMNPCPCGFAGSPNGNCRCTNEQIQRYLGKLSGPLLDRIDMQVEVPSLPPEKLTVTSMEESERSKVVKDRVIKSRERQFARQGKCNMQLTSSEVSEYCRLDEAGQSLLNQVMHKFNLSARTYHRILKVARTIADLAENDAILVAQLSEALAYRCLDRSRLSI
ncbi:MAG: YifB family Mg chelatase-like AAA ATPase [Gammaproteobacteria bacterium]